MRLETIERLLNYTDEKLHYSEIMSLKQLCNYCDFTKSFVYKQTSTREIPHYKKGKRLFFNLSSFIKEAGVAATVINSLVFFNLKITSY